MKQLAILGSAFLFSGILIFISCSDSGKADQAQQLANQVIITHGAQHFATKKVSFSFRGKSYTAERRGENYIYSRAFEDSIGNVLDVLVNSSQFKRTIEGQEIALTEEWSKRYGNSVNSVLYFVEILYHLNDAAVKKKYLGKKTIKGQPYQVLKVTFSEENGGDDFQDEYLYWIHEQDFTVDYLAYNYETDGGGVRFREAFDREQIGGITFQNYINYKPVPDTKDTPLESLPDLFEEGRLKELSRIVNENIEVL